MPDLTPQEVRAQLAAIGLTPLDGEDLDEVTHRINAVNETLAKLDFTELDAVEPVTVFDAEEEQS